MDTFDVAPFLQIGFYLTLIIFIIFSVILFYHWENFSVSRKATIETYIIFTLCSLPLLIIMAVMAF